ncbi:hypothetical protein ACLOJK_039867 [Asimina triloba]
MAMESMMACRARAGLANGSNANSVYCLPREQQRATLFFTNLQFPQTPTLLDSQSKKKNRAGYGYLTLHHQRQQYHQRMIVIRGMMKRNPKRLKYSNPPRTNKGDGIFFLEVDPSGGATWKLEPVIQLLKEGAVGVIPTDTVYAFLCSLYSSTVCKHESPLSILCHSFRDIDTYTTGFPCGNSEGQTNIFRAVKRCLPGPYTFILPAKKELPKQCTRYGGVGKYAWRKTVGVRMPDDAICQAILEKMGTPLISTSVKWPAQDEWMINPVTIANIYEQEGLDFVVDGGVRVADPSTVVDMTGRFPTIIRQGKR